MAGRADKNSGAITPESIMQISFSYAPFRCFAAGLQLGVFSHIAAGRNSIESIARAASAQPRAMRMLLDALVSLGFLRKAGGEYSLAPGAEKYLVRESPDYMGGMIETDALWSGWSHLSESIQSGGPVVTVEEQGVAEDFFAVLVRGLHIAHREPARRAAEALGAGKKSSGLKVLDVGCGSGVWGIGIAEADAKAEVTFQDFPGILDLTREYADRHGIASRSHYLPGNLNEVDFGESQFDIVLLGNILHSEGERSSRELLKKLSRSLRPGGRIAIIEIVPNDDRTGPPFGLIFALNMLIHTKEGDTFTLAEMSVWLKEAGLSRVETTDIGSPSPLVIGTKD